MTVRTTAVAMLFLCAHMPCFAQANQQVPSGVPAVNPQAPAAPQVPRQTSAPVPSPGMPSPVSTQQNPFLGGVPTGAATGAVLPLTLPDAIDRGLRYNLGLFLGEQTTRAAQAAQLFARSGLLPTLQTSTSDAGEQINLKALGFTGAFFPGIPVIVGPFNVFDARLFASQAVLNMSAIHNWRAGNENLRAARYSYQDARDIVVLGVAGLYLQAVAGRARIDAARAQFNTSEALYKRAVDMKRAGVVAGIDVVRAQVEMQAQQQRVIFFENEFEKQKLALERAIGLPVGQQITLSDQVPYAPPPSLPLEEALRLAFENRSDYRSLSALVTAAEATKRGAQAERLPAVQFTGNYGAIGPRPWDSHGTFTAAVALNIPIFEGGRIRADILQADAQLEQRKAQLGDLHNGIDQEVRTAYLDLKASGAQVEVAQSARGLAAEQLKQSEDRFAAGVTNSVEVVQSQEAVATADENYISALYAYNLAKASLARSLGGAEKTYLQFLRGTK